MKIRLGSIFAGGDPGGSFSRGVGDAERDEGYAGWAVFYGVSKSPWRAGTVFFGRSDVVLSYPQDLPATLSLRTVERVHRIIYSSIIPFVLLPRVSTSARTRIHVTQRALLFTPHPLRIPLFILSIALVTHMVARKTDHKQQTTSYR